MGGDNPLVIGRHAAEPSSLLGIPGGYPPRRVPALLTLCDGGTKAIKAVDTESESVQSRDSESSLTRRRRRNSSHYVHTRAVHTESDIILFNRTFYSHNIKSTHQKHATSHKITNYTHITQQFTQASRPTNEQADCRSPYQAVINQRVIIVIKGEISSVECCIWSERTSLGTSVIGITA
jgi:hypothetical protein